MRRRATARSSLWSNRCCSLFARPCRAPSPPPQNLAPLRQPRRLFYLFIALFDFSAHAVRPGAPPKCPQSVRHQCAQLLNRFGPGSDPKSLLAIPRTIRMRFVKREELGETYETWKRFGATLDLYSLYSDQFRNESTATSTPLIPTSNYRSRGAPGSGIVTSVFVPKLV